MFDKLFFGLLYAAPVALLALAACGGGSAAGTSSSTFQLGGTASGLVSGGLVLQNNGRDDLAVDQGAGDFAFPTRVDVGSNFNVTIKTQPTTPTHQVCAVSNGTASMPAHDVTDIQVICVDHTFQLGGNVSGLTSDGLVLQFNGANDIAVSAGSTQFTFGNRLNPGASYVINVKNNPGNPNAQTCSISNGSGTMPAQNLTIANVTCTDVPPGSFALGGTTTGLTSNGLVLQNNGGDDLAIAQNASQFSFVTPVTVGTPYEVTVKSQPTAPKHQLCSVSNSAGTMPASDFAGIRVDCVDHTFALGGTVAGLTGSGLVLQYNGGDDLNVVSGATKFEFANKLNPGSNYVVTVKSNPNLQSCTVTNGIGTMQEQNNLANVQVSCVDVPPATYSLGGSVTGLANNGLVLQNNGGDDLAVAQTATQFGFATHLPEGTAYDVRVKSQPAHQLCNVVGGVATMPASDVTGIQIRCVDYTFSLGGSISGLTSHGLVLKNNVNLEVLPVSETVSGMTTFAFASKLDPGVNYDVVVNTQPNTPKPQSCAVSGGTDVMPASNVSVIQVDCVDVQVPSHTLGGTTSGLTSDGLVLLNSVNGEELPVLGAASGVVDFTFVNSVNEGASYTVAVKNNPTAPAPQVCSVANGSGAMQGTDVVNVQVACADVTAGSVSISVTIIGLAGSGLVLQNNGGDNLAISANGGSVVSTVFQTLLAPGDLYDLSILSQPPGQTCHYLTATSGTASADFLVTVQCLSP
jgi:hypothetical protein